VSEIGSLQGFLFSKTNSIYSFINLLLYLVKGKKERRITFAEEMLVGVLVIES
jgi:hypothetical protein